MLKDELHLIINLPMERVFLLLEEGDFYRADNYCDQILDHDPRFAQAYVGKLLAELQIRTLEELLTTNIPFTASNNYQNALKFSQDPLKSFLSTAPYENFYMRANKIMQNARSEKEYQNAADIFKKISNYKDSAVLSKRCSSSALICKNNDVYEQAVSLVESKNVSDCKEALRLFQSILGWKDSSKQAGLAQQKIDKLTKKNQRTIRVIIFICSMIASIIGAYFLVTKFIIPNSHYNNAVKLMNSGDYETAISSFEALGTYRDSLEKITECQNLIKDRQYDIAKQTMANGSYDAAIVMFQDLNGYRDSKLMIDSCHAAINDSIYTEAVNMMDGGDYENAVSLLEKLNGYLDSAVLIEDCKKGVRYNEALRYIQKEKYSEALAILTEIEDFKDSKDKIVQCNTSINEKIYSQATTLISSANYIDAYVELSKLGGYKDSQTLRSSIWANYKASLKNAKNGTIIILGSYEQDNNLSNGKEPIEWYVINNNGNSILLLSKQILDRKYFNKKDDLYGISWEKSDLRSWLNNNFLTTSFSQEEQSMISLATVEAHPNPEYPNVSSGNSTQDKIFLLSIQEANQYLSNEMKRPEITKFASRPEQNFEWWLLDSDDWWLRTVGEYDFNVSTMDSGKIDYGGTLLTIGWIGVRPAMRINF
ncbi:MAG: hypothetical protein IJI14_17175 [Anaerolineaceae bacterium]|nr:hypothetical protein [Anaerolineaceae bacterium]